MPDNSLWSSAVQNALLLLSPQRSTEKFYPNHSLGKHRHPSSGSARDALEQLLREITADELDRVLFTPNVLLFARITYDDQDPPRAVEFSFQAYASPDVEIAKVPIAAPRFPVHYLRLEHHPDEPGPIFGEPALHLHSIGNGQPRTPIEFGPAGSPLLWFLEYLSFNYDYDTWSLWFETIADDIGVHTSFMALSQAFRAATIHTTSTALYPDLRRIVDAAIDIKTRAVSEVCAMHFAEPLDASLNYRCG